MVYLFSLSLSLPLGVLLSKEQCSTSYSSSSASSSRLGQCSISSFGIVLWALYSVGRYGGYFGIGRVGGYGSSLVCPSN